MNKKSTHTRKRTQSDDKQSKDRSSNSNFKFKRRKPAYRSETKKTKTDADSSLVRLNRYISMAGVCSRREADTLIQVGAITINGEKVTELGTKVDLHKDRVHYNGELLSAEKNVYILLNKPKGYVTTTKDPQNRKIVTELIGDIGRKYRLYPVGRLDRNTTGLLLLTNDGMFTTKMSHPRYQLRKIYKATLDKNLKPNDLNKLASEGITLEDGHTDIDDIHYVEGGKKNEVGITLHSGKNRIIRRIFDALNYRVIKLDRVSIATLTKKNLPRGQWRHLTEQEVNYLHML